MTTLALKDANGTIIYVKGTGTGSTIGDPFIPEHTVSTLSPLVASSAIIGKVGIDQTTDGTTNLISAKQNGTWNINNISGSISLATGAATSANQITSNNSLSSIDTKLNKGQNTSSNSLSITQSSDSYFTDSPISYDASGRRRSSQITTLFDGKTLNTDDSDLWSTYGTGTYSFLNNKHTISVTTGQFLIREQTWFCNYFSGKSQFIENTFDTFQPVTNIIKRVGYFSSNQVTPFDSNKDGYWLESDGTTTTTVATAIKLIVSNDGTATSIPFSSWDNYSLISSYDWSKFTINPSDFLWLGGSEIRIFLKLPTGGFILAHTYRHAGNNTGTIFKSPNLKLRYEIRSTTGSGSFNYICGQVATEGSNNESGKSRSIFNTTAITANTVGTIYAIKSIKKQVAFKDNVIQLVNFGLVNTASADAGILMLIKDPTISAAITYTNNGIIQEGTPTNQTITAGTGTILGTAPIAQNGVVSDIVNNFMAVLQCKLGATDSTVTEYVLAYMPTTATQSVNGIINFKIL